MERKGKDASKFEEIKIVFFPYAAAQQLRFFKHSSCSPREEIKKKHKKKKCSRILSKTNKTNKQKSHISD